MSNKPENPYFDIVSENAYFIFLALILAFGTLQFGGTIFQTENPMVSVVSCSMYPALNVGDILVVKGTEISEIQNEDIIVYDVYDEATISIAGNVYEFSEENNTLTKETNIGEVTLIEVNSRDSQEYAVFEIDGEQHRINTGDTITLSSYQIELNSATGMDIPIVHRVIDVGDDYVETKGDNNREQLSFEERVTEEQIQGRSIFRIPRIGGIKLLFMDFLGLEGSSPLVIDSYPQCEVNVSE